MRHPVLACLLLVACVAPPARAADTARPNILFIIADDLNDWVGFLRGHPQTRTPNLDRLAARGVVFANANCASPLCQPSRAAVFSGRHPFRSGAYGNDDDIRRTAPQLVLLPQQLRAAGYRTLGTGKLLHQKRADLFDESFFPEQRWSPFEPDQTSYTLDELPSKVTDDPRHLVDLGGGRKVTLPLNRMPSDRRPKDPGGESFDWGGVDVTDAEMGDAQIAAWAVERLKAPVEKPFFLGVGFYRPHIPLFAPAAYFKPFPVGATTLPPNLANDLADLPETGRKIATDAVTAGSHESVVKYRQWQAAVAAYLACVHFVDAQVGRLLDALDSGPHAKNTIIVFFGDHGWHLGEKQHWGKLTGWERSVRVPLVIAPAARDRAQYAVGRASAQPVSLLDLYPTLLEYSGTPAPKNALDGQSLLPLLRAPQTKTGRAVISTVDRIHFSVRDERWRYLRYADGGEELYDLLADPNEWTNLAGKPEHAGTRARLAAELPHDPVPPATVAPRKKK
ncbi:sulfatase [Horticoccus sp. 23ND18S-11]|uniref:sulfatase n=1 Tax=Horticoccus sp. 23ND18S-11 TaxID=3391832 RepID=UPI0039C9C5E3